MTTSTDFLPGGGMVNVGNAEEPWDNVHANKIHGELDGNAKTATEAAGYSVVNGIPCFTYTA